MVEREKISEKAAKALEEQITSGVLSGRLPSIVNIAKSFGISPVSASQAIHLLKEKGLVEIRQGLPTKVAGSSMEITSFTELPFTPEDLAALTLKQEALSIEQLTAIGLHLFTQRRVAEVAYEDEPNPENLRTYLTTSGREMVFARLISQHGAGEGLSAAGIRRIFVPEIRAFEQAPTIGDALIAAGEPKKF